MNTELKLPRIEELYKDNQACADAIGLSYVQADDQGYIRKHHGKSFRYYDYHQNSVDKDRLKKHITELVIPPAWKDVWICPRPNGHILATGLDDKGRKQYIYHPKWRAIRDLIKFYRLIVFGQSLPKIRRHVNENIEKNDLSFDHVISIMIWTMDNSYIRVGNDIYFEENDSLGLTTLSSENAVIAGSTITFTFKGKSGKQQLLAVDNKQIAEAIKKFKKPNKRRLFTYKNDDEDTPVSSQDINDYLRAISNEDISAKDFRTWGGSLLAFDHLIHQMNSEKKPEKVSIEAVDAAAGVLGNTRAVARSSYVHPDLLEVYGSKNFERYYQKANQGRKKALLSKRESELLEFLKILLEEEFKGLQQA